MDKGKTKMPEYEDDHFDDNESIHSLDSEFGGFDVPIRVKKDLTKMSEYEDDHFDDNESTHSLDSEFGGFDVPIGVKKDLTSANEKLHRSTGEKNPVTDSATTTIWHITMPL